MHVSHWGHGLSPSLWAKQLWFSSPIPNTKFWNPNSIESCGKRWRCRGCIVLRLLYDTVWYTCIIDNHCTLSSYFCQVPQKLLRERNFKMSKELAAMLLQVEVPGCQCQKCRFVSDLGPCRTHFCCKDVFYSMTRMENAVRSPFGLGAKKWHYDTHLESVPSVFLQRHGVLRCVGPSKRHLQLCFPPFRPTYFDHERVHACIYLWDIVRSCD